MDRAGAGVAAFRGAPELRSRVMVLYCVRVERMVVVVSAFSVRVGAGTTLHTCQHIEHENSEAFTYTFGVPLGASVGSTSGGVTVVVLVIVTCTVDGSWVVMVSGQRYVTVVA